jgi:hypothetical protein
VIIIDGQDITTPDTGDEAAELRQARLEVKLCKALAALDPPHGLQVILHGRIAGHLRALNRHGAPGPDARQPADLTDDELRDAAGIIRALLALPSPGSGHSSAHGLRTVLGRYALDLAHEITTRAEPETGRRDDAGEKGQAHQPCPVE